MDNRVSVLEDRVNKLEKKYDRLDERLDQVEKDQTETKVYIKQIFSSLEDLKLTIRSSVTKEDLFKFLQTQKQMELEAAERERQMMDRQNERQNGLAALDTWQKTLLAVLGGTLFVVIGYIFGAK
jgi:hypothetical protein